MWVKAFPFPIKIISVLTSPLLGSTNITKKKNIKRHHIRKYHRNPNPNHKMKKVMPETLAIPNHSI